MQDTLVRYTSVLMEKVESQGWYLRPRVDTMDIQVLERGPRVALVDRVFTIPSAPKVPSLGIGEERPEGR